MDTGRRNRSIQVHFIYLNTQICVINIGITLSPICYYRISCVKKSLEFSFSSLHSLFFIYLFKWLYTSECLFSLTLLLSNLWSFLPRQINLISLPGAVPVFKKLLNLKFAPIPSKRIDLNSIVFYFFWFLDSKKWWYKILLDTWLHCVLFLSTSLSDWMHLNGSHSALLCFKIE